MTRGGSHAPTELPLVRAEAAAGLRGLGEKGDRGGGGEEEREEPAAMAVDALGGGNATVGRETGGEQHLDERKEDEEGAGEDEGVEASEVRELGNLGSNRKAVGNQGEHGSHRHADLGATERGVDPEDHPGHHDDEEQ